MAVSVLNLIISRHREFMLPWLVLILSATSSLAGWQLADHYVSEHREQIFRHTVRDALHDIHLHLERYQQVLLGAAGLMRASERVTRDEWRSYYEYQRLSTNYAGLGGIGWIDVISPSELAAHEQRMRSQGFSGYSVKPAGQRDVYSAITMYEPFTPENQRALGLDGLTEEVRRRAMDWARDTGSPVLTGKLRLFLGADTSNQIGMIMYMPVYRQGEVTESLEDRRRALRGYVLSGFRINTLIEGMFDSEKIRNLDMRIFDGNETLPEQLIYDSFTRLSPDPSPLALTALERLNLPGSVWTFEFTPRASLFSGGEAYLPVIILWGGLLLSALLFALLMFSARSARRINERSAELALEMTSDLRESEARFRQVVEASPNGILMVDRHGRITLCNGRLEQMFAYPPGSLLGQPLEVLLPESLRSMHERLRQEFVENASMRMMGQGRYLFGLRADGLEFPVEVALSPVDTPAGQQILTLVNDVTERLAAERQIARAQAQLQGVVDSASEFSIIATDNDGLITIFNTGAERMLGYRAEEMIGKQTPAILHLPEEVQQRGAELSQAFGQQIEGFDVFVFKARHGEAESREWTYLRKDGSRITVMLTVTAMHDTTSGEIIGLMGIAYDVTARKQTERLQQEALDAAEAASRSKSEFLANMSHEIRTPLNAVLGMAQVLGFGKLDAEQREQLRLIEVSGKALLGILNDILDFSKIEAGRMELSPVPFHLSDVCDALAGIMSVSASDKEISLAIQVDPALPRVLLGDQLRLQQVLVNLAGNAIKFTSRGEVLIRLEQLRREGTEVFMRCSVKDSGIGMTEEQIGRLFAPFVQADTSMTRRYGGSGLGLVICKRLVSMMGGTIGVSSVPGEGSTFKFTLRMQALAEDQSSQTPPLQELQIQDLLVVDASDGSAGSLVAAAEALGVCCESCGSESEAMARVITRGRNPDIVLIDWNMPDRGRALLIQQLRVRKPDAPPPIVLAVSNSHGRDQLDADPLLVSLDGVLVKPVTSSTLLDSVMQACSRRDNDRDLRRIMQLPEVQLRARSLRGARMLLVEDNSINQMVARGILQQVGAVIDVANHGQEAVDRLRAHPELYVAILMDVQMPVMDGCTATRIIRKELGIRLPIIAMTAGVLQTQRDECMAAGMDEFLSKPLDASLIVETLERVLGQSVASGTAERAEDRNTASEAGATPASPTSIEIPGLVRTEALARIGNNEALYRELLLQFCIETGPLPEAVRRHIERGEFKDAGRAFHTLKSTAANIGANALSDHARMGEHAMHQADVDAAMAALNEVETTLDLLLPAITNQLESRKTGGLAASGADRVALQQLLKQLRHHDMDALDSFEYLRGGLHVVANAAQAEHLTSLIVALDFDPAADLLEQMLA